MAYNEQLAQRVEHFLSDLAEVHQRKMFGGLCFMVNGNMCCGVIKERLVVRVGPENYDKYLKLKHAAPMDFTGKPLTGFIYIDKSGIKTNAGLVKWLDRAKEFCLSLPPK